MGNTRKVKHAGRFGSRYGKGIRDRVVEIEEKQRSLHFCTNCGFLRVKRISTGLFKCKKCGFVFTGGAFTPSTMSGRIVKKMVSQRKFLPMVKGLIALKEEKTKGLEEKKIEEKEGKEEPEKKAGKPETKKGQKKEEKKKAETRIEPKKEEPEKEPKKTPMEEKVLPEQGGVINV